MFDYERMTLTAHDLDVIRCNRCTVNGHAQNVTITGDRNVLYVSHSIINGARNTVHGTGNTIRGDRNTVHGSHCFIEGDRTSLYDPSGTSTVEGKHTTRYGAKSVSGNSNISNISNVSNSFNNCGDDSLCSMGPGAKYTYVSSHSPVVTHYNNTARVHTTSIHSPANVSPTQPVIVDLTREEKDERGEEPKVSRTTTVVSVIRAEADEPEENSELACIICLERKRKCAAFPCRHLRYCHTCCLALQRRPPLQCSECRTQVTHFEAFY
jgi:hypothetical protein